MVDYKSLENIDIEILHNAFVNAFSAYQVKMDLPLTKFQNMLLRRGYNSKISMGAFDNGELIGFVLNGLRIWDGKLTAYDTGTGVIERYRKKGITNNLFQYIKELLKEFEVKHYLLEVIQSNTVALELYKKSGFEITREFECFKLDKINYNQMTNYIVEDNIRINFDDWKKLTEFWDFKPSWQNSIDSINSVNTLSYSIVRLDGIIVGYGVIDKITGDIAQIAVHKNYRRKGVASSIITDLLSNTDSNNVFILNVDGQCKSLIKFLYDLGFQNYVSQYEMMINI